MTWLSIMTCDLSRMEGCPSIAYDYNSIVKNIGKCPKAQDQVNEIHETAIWQLLLLDRPLSPLSFYHPSLPMNSPYPPHDTVHFQTFSRYADMSAHPNEFLGGLTSTIDVPSLNLALNKTFALVNNPSLSETTMNWLPLNLFLNSWPICCVCCRSRAESISSRIYIGAGLNCSNDMMRDRAMRDLASQYLRFWQEGDIPLTTR